ncbi:hypothetical protein HA402_006321 [Bradysia odoriphaga]|nr:hypothetical protein HA402_006321 [Bradysia odoriphaga]
MAKCTEYQKICPLEALPFNLDDEVAVAKEFPHMENVDVRDFNVSETFLYPDYAVRSFTNDIALLKIDRTVDFSEHIQPACLPHLNTEISNKVVATGWGKTVSAMHKRPSSLQKVPLNLVSFDVCKESYPPSLNFQKGPINQTQLCAGSNRGERDTCAGFGGGPLPNTGRKFSCLHEIVGITSFGKGCGDGDPGVYTRVTSYIDWIEGIVWSEKTKQNRQYLLISGLAGAGRTCGSPLNEFHTISQYATNSLVV